MHPFQIMAEPVRRRIVEILASGEHASGELTAVISHDFGLTRSAVARHLAFLLDERWVAVRPDYANRYYRLLEDRALGSLRRELRWLEYLWERRIGTTEQNDPQPHHVEPFDPSGSTRCECIH
jgi:DNA-binding transcriptional ArsR family regulator